MAAEPVPHETPLGYNTEVSHRGITYHVQTEAMDLDPGAVNTLVFHDGALLHKLSTRHEDLSREELARRVRRQHTKLLNLVRKGEFAP